MKQYFYPVLCALWCAGVVSFLGLAQAEAGETTSLVEPLRMVEPEPLSAGRYVAGGLVGSTLGLGIGHAIAGQYRNMGLFFTISEVVSLVVVGAGVGIGGKAVFNIGRGTGITDAASGLSNVGAVLAGASMALTGVVLYGIFHLWELFDIWIRPAGRLSHRPQRTEVRVGQSAHHLSRAQGGMGSSGRSVAILAI